MMETILNHVSIRKYLPTPIDTDTINKILNAAIRGSNTGNMQVYSIIATTKPEIKEKLWEAHFKQDMVKQAPLHLTFCADVNRFNKWCELRNTEPGYNNFLWFINGAVDAIIAAQNACIAAESFGLGICYLGTATYNADKLIEILNLPQGVIPVTSVVVGYPENTPALTDRLPAEAVVHYETYNNFDERKINSLYAEKEAMSQTLELIKINGTENLAQIFTQKRYTLKDNLHFSQKYFDILQKQGFFNNLK